MSISRVWRTEAQVFFGDLAWAALVILSAGLDFLRRPVGLLTLVLMLVWFSSAVVFRPSGPRSEYNRSQWPLLLLVVPSFILLFIAMPWEYTHLTGPIPRDGGLAWLGLDLFAVGIGLQLAAFRELRGYYTTRLAVQRGQKAVTSGPYRLVRHPGYLSNIMSFLGLALALSSLAGLALTAMVTAAILWRIPHEERMLEAELGEEYRDYRRRTKRLIPRVW